jgi:hypothetical protein
VSIFYDVEPLSEAWLTLRLGIPTSSQFHRIITPKKMQISSQAPKYMHELLAEWITGEQIEGFQSEWMIRGVEVEDSIWKAYEGYADTETQRGGFFTTDDGMAGCSPDRLVGDDGDLEAKAPMLTTQIGYALAEGPDDDYKTQLQGRFMIHEREWIDIFSWHPKLFLPPIRVHRDDKFIAALKPVLEQFTHTMLECRLVLEKRFGPFERPKKEERAAPDDPGELGVTDEDVEIILRQAELKGLEL